MYISYTHRCRGHAADVVPSKAFSPDVGPRRVNHKGHIHARAIRTVEYEHISFPTNKKVLYRYKMHRQWRHQLEICQTQNQLLRECLSHAKTFRFKFVVNKMETDVEHS